MNKSEKQETIEGLAKAYNALNVLEGRASLQTQSIRFSILRLGAEIIGDNKLEDFRHLKKKELQVVRDLSIVEFFRDVETYVKQMQEARGENQER